MPLPSPTPNEDHDQFIERCMDEAAPEFPDEDQRRAVCETQWEKGMNKTRLKAFRGRPGRGCYEVRNADGDVAEVYIYDAIDWIGVNAEDFVQEISQITAGTINLRINSPGGDVFDGVAIANALRNHKARVHTFVDGLAASIASIIALSGDEITMARGSFFMIHNPWAGVIGTADDMRHTAGILDKIQEQLQQMYMDRTGKGADEIRQMMADETWLNAEESVEMGLADNQANEPAARAAFDLSAFAHVPDELAASQSDSGRPSETDLERSLREAGLSRSEAVAFVARGKQALSAPSDSGDEQGREEMAQLLKQRRDLFVTH